VKKVACRSIGDDRERDIKGRENQSRKDMQDQFSRHLNTGEGNRKEKGGEFSEVSACYGPG